MVFYRNRSPNSNVSRNCSRLRYGIDNLELLHVGLLTAFCGGAGFLYSSSID